MHVVFFIPYFVEQNDYFTVVIFYTTVIITCAYAFEVGLGGRGRGEGGMCPRKMLKFLLKSAQ